MSLKLHVASCTDKCYRTLCAAGQSCEQEVWEIPWLPATLNFGLKSCDSLAASISEEDNL